jgi:YggT family protein
MQIMCQVWGVVDVIFRVYLLVLLIYAIVSWIPSIRGRWFDYVARLVDPVLTPVRQIIPPIGGLDLSFLVVIILLQIIDSNIVQPQHFTACSLY